MSGLWSTLWQIVRDPRVRVTLILGFWVVAGLATLAGAYRGTAGLGLVAFQLPYVISGGFGGIAILGTALGLMSVHFDRVESIEERRDLAELHRRTMQFSKNLAERRQASSTSATPSGR